MVVIVETFGTFPIVPVQLIKYHGDHAAKHYKTDYVHDNKTLFSIPSLVGWMNEPLLSSVRLTITD